MFFKKKVPVDQYCTQVLTTLFSKDREAAWEALRDLCKDGALSDVEAQLYYRHVRAVIVVLMLVAISKNCSMRVSSDAHAFVLIYLRDHKLSEIYEISHAYSQAFGRSSLAPNRDGVAEMVADLSVMLTSDKLQEGTVKRFYLEFYGMLRVFFDDHKSLKLVPMSWED